MLSLQAVSSCITVKGEQVNLLEDISASFQPGQFIAIVGPSGCGKTSLIKTIAGMNETSAGRIIWKNEDLEKKDFSPHELGYIPQFSIACEDLTVSENVRYAAELRVSPDSTEERDKHLAAILEQTGLTELAETPVKVISGGQKRRLSLAIELTTNPEILLCDEVTSGLDLHSEKQIIQLLKSMAKEENRIVLSVTHSLESLDDYDAVVVLYQGMLAYHGPPDQILTYFKARSPSGIYLQLLQLPPDHWRKSWKSLQLRYPVFSEVTEKKPPSPPEAPSVSSQTKTLLQRRIKIFFRDRAQTFISLALIIGFPLLVILFSERGREPIRKLSEIKEQNIFLELQNQAAVHQDQLTVGSAVSGIIMFQVVLLCLMGSNNSAREISGERQIWEKERLAGVSPTAYLASKIAFLSTLVLIQSSVMAVLVELFWPFRGDFMIHWLSLILVNAAMTSICLAISALLKTPTQSSLLSVYLVGFQLPLSGAILTLPALPETLTKPFISAYWSWSASIDSLQENIYTAVRTVSGTDLSYANNCYLTLLAHILIGLTFAFLGIKRSFTN